MIPIIGPIVAALGSALGIGAAGGAATGIGALLSNAWLPALGTGIGTLLTGGSGKDALKNAAIAGGGSMLFPEMGKNLSGGIAQLMGIGGNQSSGPTNMGMAARFAPPPRSVDPNPNPPPVVGADIQERRNSILSSISEMARTGSATPGDRQSPMNFIPGMFDLPKIPEMESRTGSATPGDRQSPMNFIPKIPEMESSLYESPYLAMMREKQDQEKTAVEDLLRFNPDLAQTPEERAFDVSNRRLDLFYQGYNEDPENMSGDVDPSIAKNLPYIDPYVMKRYATKSERDAEMDQSMAYYFKGVPLKTFKERKYATGGEPAFDLSSTVAAYSEAVKGERYLPSNIGVFDEKTAVEELLTFNPDLVQTLEERAFEEDRRRIDLLYRGYIEDPNITKNLPYIDPYTMKRYTTKSDRDAEMDQSGNSSWRSKVFKARKEAGGYATGGEIQGPGTGTSDSVPATIYQNGTPVKKAALSDGEFVMTAKAVRGMGNGSRKRGVTRMYELMRRFENGETA